MTRSLLTLVLAASGLALCGYAGVCPAPLIGRNMVLQQGTEVPIYGKADPGERITVSFCGQQESAVASKDGRWKIMLEPLEAGGPFQMGIAGKTEAIIYGNVMVGEVWVCSGQSNMAFAMRKSASAKEEIPKASYPEIRYFRAEAWGSEKPAETVRGKWQVCTPENVADFSAVAYFLARKLHQSLEVPVGIVAGAAGATSVYNWMSVETMKARPRTAAIVDGMVKKAGFQAAKEALRAYATYQREFCLRDRGNTGVTKGWAAVECEEDGWNTMELPGLWETGGKRSKLPLEIDAGAVWFRKTVTIPDAWKGGELSLRLGGVDDGDVTYFNGKEVGRTKWDEGSKPRRYSVPASLVKPGKAVVAVRVFNVHGRGGFEGGREDLHLSAVGGPPRALTLAGPWKFKVEYRVPWWEMRPPCHHRFVPGLFYNTIAAPFSKYAVRGIAWYQAEGHPGEDYLKAFPLQIQDWRALWGREDLPFIYVQHARFGKQRTGLTPATGAEVWAGTRQAQLETLSLMRNTAMAVSFDVTDGDLHPSRKKEVGERLALAALGAVYGKDIVWSGPLFDRLTREGNRLHIAFKHVGSGLTTNDGEPLRDFAVGGADGKFIAATAEIRDGAVVVWSGAVKEPVAVRYSWADYPAGNLFNREGLPASPFAANLK